MLLSWKLWRWLDAVPPSHPIHRLLNVKSENTPVPTVVMLMGIGGLCICAIFPYILLPIGILWFGLHFSLRIAGTIAKQHEVGNQTLLAVTPMGALGSGLAISHLYTMGTRAVLTMGLILAIGGTAVMGLIALMMLLTSPVSGSNNFAFGILLLGTWGIGSFTALQMFIQELSLGVIVGMLAGSMGERNTARVATVGGYVGIQGACYFLLWMSFNLITMLVAPLALDQNFEAVIRLLFTALVFFSVREIIIYALWRQVLLRFNDDMPTLKVKTQ